MAILNTVADRQAGWSVTANNLKSTVDHERWGVFVFSVAGAVLAAIASQWDSGSALGARDPRVWIAILGALSLAVATFFTQRLLGADCVSAWVRARAISEALKREAYRYAGVGAPYDNAGNADATLDAERSKIEDDGADLLAHYVPDAGPGSVPRKKLTPQEYIAGRVDGQVAFFRNRAENYQRTVKSLRWAEFWLVLAATLVTAIASVAGKSNFGFGLVFDIAALTTVLTTIAATVLAHVEASRFDFLVTTYLATARRLEDRKNRTQEPFSAFVNDCENIIAAENTSWIAKWSKPLAS